ncbi:hypothetical protein C5L25_000213 [Secundilactobacillus silagei JCM 19001]|uniref:Transcriptional regulator n=1 Tax=Secundilactobacillus silagei JCM 19001 TaxID=1302250 RepID=A0A1Z5IGW5_9LACO|nr:hypothetical protein C5L25_000213 [Secundilactobacillus silagei JCM 19001]GAX01005.1 transcriptional regulator [Secundilactobacillus silagei JCM 19001]
MIKFALDKVMKERNLTIQEVMNATGITRPTISQLSSGKAKGIQFDTLNKLVSGLRLETYELFDEIYPQEQLSYKINWIDLDMSADKIDENFTFDENEPLFEVNFFSPENIHDEYSISSFRLPISVSFESTINTSDNQDENKIDTIIFSCLYDFVADTDLPTRNDMALKDYFSTTNKAQFETTIGSICFDCIKKLNLANKQKFVVFRSDINNLMNDEWSTNFSWNESLLADPPTFEKFIDIKYH